MNAPTVNCRADLNFNCGAYPFSKKSLFCRFEVTSPRAAEGSASCGAIMLSSVAISVGLPVLLFIIMLGLGLSLRFDDFTSVLSNPKPLLIGLTCQIFIMPLVCFGLVYVSELPPFMAVGMMLLAASPGGSSAILFTHLARGDVALSLCLVAVTSVLTIFSIPIVANLALDVFYGDTKPVTVHFQHVLQIFVVAIVPIMIGIFIHQRWPALSERLERPVKTLATLFLASVILFALITEWQIVVEWGPVVGLTVVAFSVSSLAVGYFVPRAFDVRRRQAIALAMAIGLHNAALVMTLALSNYMLNEPEMAIPPALYGVVAYIICGGLVWLLNQGKVISRA
jgi:BASS family bile acid:Na+ symporter